MTSVILNVSTITSGEGPNPLQRVAVNHRGTVPKALQVATVKTFAEWW